MNIQRNELIAFNATIGSDNCSVRAVRMNGEPWFVGKDVALHLGYSDTDQAIRKHVDDEDKTDGVAICDSIGRQQHPVFINESGMYSLIMFSHLPTAKAFKRWVTSEVIPSIRKTGSYAMDTTGAINALAEQPITDPELKEAVDRTVSLYREKMSGMIFSQHRDTDDELAYAARLNKLYGKDTAGQAKALDNYRKYKRLVNDPYCNYREDEDEPLSLPTHYIEPPVLKSEMTLSEAMNLFNEMLRDTENVQDTNVYHKAYLALGIPHKYDRRFYAEYKRRCK